MTSRQTDTALRNDGATAIDRLFSGVEGWVEAVADATEANEVAQEIYALRERYKLTQKELAMRVGTTQSVIARLEDANYEGHSLAMLRRIAIAVGERIKVTFEKPKTVARARRRPGRAIAKKTAKTSRRAQNA
ncbi:MAG: XRE family transcriptional regulator [Gemmatimonadota bacterium]